MRAELPKAILIIGLILILTPHNNVYAVEKCSEEIVEKQSSIKSIKELRKMKRVQKALNRKIVSEQIKTDASCDEDWVVDLIFVLLRQCPILGVIVLLIALIVAACG